MTFSLKKYLIVPYAILVLTTTSLVAIISFIYFQSSVDEISNMLYEEIMNKVETHLHNILEKPYNIVQTSKYLLEKGHLNYNKKNDLKNYFLNHVKETDCATSFYFGNKNGDFVGSGKEEDGSSYYTTRLNKKTSSFENYSVDERGIEKKLIAKIPGFNPQNRPWYLGAAESGKVKWNDIYKLYTNHDLSISASVPAYDKNKKLIGVISIDVFLSHLSRFLQ